MSLSRREFLKSSAAASAAAAMGMTIPAELQAAADVAESNWRWDKAACRFCGTGCGIMMATKDGKIVAVKGDPAAPVNRGLNCIKGYFNAKIMYGADRLTQPLLRVGADGKFDKKGDFTNIAMQAFPILSVFILFDLLQLILSGALRGAGNVSIVMMVRLVTCFAYFVPVSYVLSQCHFQDEAIKLILLYGSFYFGNALMSIWYIRRFRGEGWKTPTL